MGKDERARERRGEEEKIRRWGIKLSKSFEILIKGLHLPCYLIKHA